MKEISKLKMNTEYLKLFLIANQSVFLMIKKKLQEKCRYKIQIVHPVGDERFVEKKNPFPKANSRDYTATNL